MEVHLWRYFWRTSANFAVEGHDFLLVFVHIEGLNRPGPLKAANDGDPGFIALPVPIPDPKKEFKEMTKGELTNWYALAQEAIYVATATMPRRAQQLTRDAAFLPPPFFLTRRAALVATTRASDSTGDAAPTRAAPAHNTS